MTGSTKGKPTDQKLHDEITEKIKAQSNKDGVCLSIESDLVAPPFRSQKAD